MFITKKSSKPLLSPLRPKKQVEEVIPEKKKAKKEEVKEVVKETKKKTTKPKKEVFVEEPVVSEIDKTEEKE